MFWLLLTGTFAGLMANQASRYGHFNSELKQVRENLEREKKIYEQLKDQRLYYDSDAYVEQLARDQLGYVRPDEIVFVNIAD